MDTGQQQPPHDGGDVKTAASTAASVRHGVAAGSRRKEKGEGGEWGAGNGDRNGETIGRGGEEGGGGGRRPEL